MLFSKVHGQHVVTDILGEAFETEMLGGKKAKRQAGEEDFPPADAETASDTAIAAASGDSAPTPTKPQPATPAAAASTAAAGNEQAFYTQL